MTNIWRQLHHTNKQCDHSCLCTPSSLYSSRAWNTIPYRSSNPYQHPPSFSNTRTTRVHLVIVIHILPWVMTKLAMTVNMVTVWLIAAVQIYDPRSAKVIISFAPAYVGKSPLYVARVTILFNHRALLTYVCVQLRSRPHFCKWNFHCTGRYEVYPRFYREPEGGINTHQTSHAHPISMNILADATNMNAHASIFLFVIVGYTFKITVSILLA